LFRESLNIFVDGGIDRAGGSSGGGGGKVGGDGGG